MHRTTRSSGSKVHSFQFKLKTNISLNNNKHGSIFLMNRIFGGII
jgi:hypothetical protein